MTTKSRTRAKPLKNEKISKYFAPAEKDNAKLTVNIPRELIDIDSDFESTPRKKTTRGKKRVASSRSRTKQPPSKKTKTTTSRMAAGARIVDPSTAGTQSSRGREQQEEKKKVHHGKQLDEKDQTIKRELFIESGVSDEKGGEASDTGEEGGSVELEEKVFQKVCI